MHRHLLYLSVSVSLCHVLFLTGYKRTSAPHDALDACEDIDECAEHSDRCSPGVCINTDGGYTCDCDAGYEPSEDGQSCIGEINIIQGILDYTLFSRSLMTTDGRDYQSRRSNPLVYDLHHQVLSAAIVHLPKKLRPQFLLVILTFKLETCLYIIQIISERYLLC